jgi:hypothetical protein
VQLYLYDLSQGMVKNFSRAMIGKQIDGIWHTGVVIHFPGSSPREVRSCRICVCGLLYDVSIGSTFLSTLYLFLFRPCSFPHPLLLVISGFTAAASKSRPPDAHRPVVRCRSSRWASRRFRSTSSTSFCARFRPISLRQNTRCSSGIAIIFPTKCASFCSASRFRRTLPDCRPRLVP